MRYCAVMLGMLAALLSGCGTSRPSLGGAGNPICGLDKYYVKDSYDQLHVYFLPAPAMRVQGLQDSRAAAASGPRELNVLELSAGGAYGAYGAGFLLGWGEAGALAKPVARSDIQVVTGVSTGSIMATYAFLGNRDQQLVDFYKQLDDTKVYSKNSLLSLITATSLYNTQGKRNLLKTYLTREVIDEVAAAQPGRQLYIGFVDLDSGEFKRVDMIALVHGIADKDLRDNCYRAVVDASSAIEVAFEPVFIDGMLLGDGGVRRHLFLVSSSPSQPIADPAKAAAEQADLGARKLRTFSLLHGNLDVGTETTANGVLTIAQRTMSIFTDQTFKDSVRLSHALAVDPAVVVGPEAAKKLPHFEPFYAAAASASCTCTDETKAVCGPASSGGTDIFCPQFMQCLSRIGEQEGRLAATSGQWLPFEKLNLGSKPGCPAPGTALPTRDLLFK